MTTDIDRLFFTAEEQLSRDLDDMLRIYHNNRPRNLQRELGPSEVGHPCRRKLAYGLMQEPEINPGFDPLPSFVGTEAHSGMADAAEAANKRLGRTRWLAEHRVTVTGSLAGSCDLFDLDTKTVIDHKFLSATRIKKYRGNPPQHYRRQLHLYGRGFINLGFQVDNVMLHMLPRGGVLTGKATFYEPYNDALVDDTLNTLSDIMLLIYDLDVEHHPQRYNLFPATPDADCVYCPFYAANPQTPLQCNGKQIGDGQPPSEAERWPSVPQQLRK